MRAYLEHFPEQGGPAKRVEITKNPFVIGRSPTADLTIYSQKVSKDHALIAQDSGRYLVRDLSQHQWNLRQRQANRRGPSGRRRHHSCGSLGILLLFGTGHRLALLQHGVADSEN